MTSRAVVALAAKDLRALLPAWIATLTLVLLAALTDPWYGKALIPLAYSLGSFAVGALAFGHEYTHGTLALTLAQPINRRAALVIKLTVVALLVASIALAMAWAGGRNVRDATDAIFLPLFLLVGLLSLFAAPALTMASRNIIAGVVFTLVLPASVWLAADLVGLWIHGPGKAGAIDAFRVSTFWRLTYTMCGIGALATWVLFGRLEAVDARGQHVQIADWEGDASQPSAARRDPVLALIGKELRIHQMALVVSALYVAGMIVQAILIWLDPTTSAFAVLPVTTLHGGAVAMLIGALASAEERQFGTWQSQQLLPIPAWQQWIIKVGVALALVLLLGTAVPTVLVLLLPVLRDGTINALGFALLVFLTALSLFVSSLSASGIRALAGSVAAAVGCVIFFQWLVFSLPGLIMSACSGCPSPLLRPVLLQRIMPATGVAVIALLLVLGFRNHRSGERSLNVIIGQIVLLMGAAAGAVALIVLIGL